MQLTNISYQENKGLPSHWRVERLTLGGISLVVGKNSSGKTRLLNVIDNIAKMVSGRIFATSGEWKANFERRKGQALEHQEYSLNVAAGTRLVVEESFEINHQRIMHRQESGAGFVLKKSSKSRVQYKVPQDQLMAVVRRDEIQHPYFDHLHRWGAGLCYYRFGSELGKNSFTALAPNEPTQDSNLLLAGLVDNAAHVYRKTFDRFKDVYKSLILDDLQTLGFPCSDVVLAFTPGLIFNGIPPMQLGVMEKDRTWPTYQGEMSQGMYRAFAICVQMNANILWEKSLRVGRELALGDAPMVVIDDIGEGLDYTRSKALVRCLIEKATENNIQLVMSSNDRFIMNDVPLENWVILHREGSEVRAFDYQNSKELFEEFQYLGLNNFDFFSGELFLRNSK